MNGVNLIPAHRLVRRHRAARVRMWLAIAPVCVSALAGSYGYLFATWETSTSDLQQRIETAEARTSRAEQEVKKINATIKETSALLDAGQTVADQPDWGLLLSSVTERLQEDTVLNTITLEAMQPGSAPQSAQSKPDPSVSLGRPGKFRLTLAGVGRTQRAVSDVAMRFDRSGLFDMATLIESRRVSFHGADAVQFRIECAITDAPQEARTP